MTTQLKSNLALSLGLVAVNIVLFNLLFAKVGVLRVDMTEGNVYSLSEATERILSNLDEEVRLKGYFSKTENIHERLRPFVPEIKDLLEEFGEASNGNVRVEIIDPEANEAEETRARDVYGLEPNAYAYSDQRQQGVRSFYFAIVVEYATSKPIVIGFNDLIKSSQSMFDQEERIEMKNVEFAVTRAIKRARTGFEGQKDIFAKFDHKAKITTYMTAEADLAELFQKIPPAAKKVFKEMASNSLGKLEYAEGAMPKSREEDQELAARYEIGPLQVPGTDKPFYLWAVLEIDKEQPFPIPLVNFAGENPEKEVRDQFEAIFKRMSKGILRKVGILQSKPEMNPMAMQMGRGQEPPPFEGLSRALEEDYLVETLDYKGMNDIPGDIDCLLVMDPRNVSERASYAIDQFVMRGGKAIFCVDGTNVPQFDLSAPTLRVTQATSGIEGILANWGIEISKTVVMDEDCSTFFWPVSKSARTRPRLTDFSWPALVFGGASSDSIDPKSAPFLAGGEPVRFWFPSSIKTTKVDGIEIADIVKSSSKAWNPKSFGSDSVDLTPDLQRYPSTGYGADQRENVGEKTLAVLAKGKFKSAFATKPIPPTGDEKMPESAPTSQPTGPVGAPLKEVKSNRIIVFANSDWLDMTQYGMAQQIPRPYGYFLPNATAIKNTVDWMMEDDELLTIRNRGRSFRPLEKVEPSRASWIIGGNCALPISLIIGLGVGVYLTRKNRRPVI